MTPGKIYIDFKDRFRLNRKNFEFILNKMKPYIEKTPTNILPTLIYSDCQLALTIYRFVHGCMFFSRFK